MALGAEPPILLAALRAGRDRDDELPAGRDVRIAGRANAGGGSIALPKEAAALAAEAPLILPSDPGRLERQREFEPEPESVMRATERAAAFEIGIAVPEERRALEAELPIWLPLDAGTGDRELEVPAHRQMAAVAERGRLVDPGYEIGVLRRVAREIGRDIAEEEVDAAVGVPGIGALIDPSHVPAAGVGQKRVADRVDQQRPGRAGRSADLPDPVDAQHLDRHARPPFARRRPSAYRSADCGRCIFTGASIKSRIGTKSDVARCGSNCLSYNANDGGLLSARCHRDSARRNILERLHTAFLIHVAMRQPLPPSSVMNLRRLTQTPPRHREGGTIFSFGSYVAEYPHGLRAWNPDPQLDGETRLGDQTHEPPP